MLGLSAFTQPMEVIYTYAILGHSHKSLTKFESRHSNMSTVNIPRLKPCAYHVVATREQGPERTPARLHAVVLAAAHIPCTQDVVETLSCSWANVTPQGDSYPILRYILLLCDNSMLSVYKELQQRLRDGFQCT